MPSVAGTLPVLLTLNMLRRASELLKAQRATRLTNLQKGNLRLAEKKPMGRPSSYSGELCAEICARLSEGESLRSICRDSAMPHMVTVLRWVGSDEHVDFRNQYVEARAAGLEHKADEILEIADAEIPAGDSTAVAKQRLQIDARKWVLSKLAPKKYGDAATLSIGNKEGETLKIDANADNIALTKLLSSVVAQQPGADETDAAA
jgi:hypothetical protein